MFLKLGGPTMSPLIYKISLANLLRHANDENPVLAYMDWNGWTPSYLSELIIGIVPVSGIMGFLTFLPWLLYFSN